MTGRSWIGPVPQFLRSRSDSSSAPGTAWGLPFITTIHGDAMHLLPTTLACLADQTEKNPVGRFALSNIQLRLHNDNTFTAASTDTKVLVRVTGPCVGPVEEYPDHPALATAPNGKLEALIPAASWRKVFSTAAKVTKKQKSV